MIQGDNEANKNQATIASNNAHKRTQCGVVVYLYQYEIYMEKIHHNKGEEKKRKEPLDELLAYYA